MIAPFLPSVLTLLSTPSLRFLRRQIPLPSTNQIRVLSRTAPSCVVIASAAVKLQLRSSESFQGNIEAAYLTGSFSITSLGTGPYLMFTPSVTRFHRFCPSGADSLLATSNTPLFAWPADERFLLLASTDSQSAYINNIVLLTL